MSRLFLLLLSLFFFLKAEAEFINIGIHTSKNVKSFEFYVKAGKYSLFTEFGKLIEIDSKSAIRVEYVENKVRIQRNDQILGLFEKINFIGTGWYNHFKILSKDQHHLDVRYDDNLKVVAHRHKMQLINNINLDNYVAGVVEAEVGRKPPREYFKLQAIICRTYALSNTQKHLIDGFNLCDQVHCQAYHGKTFFEDIVDAALQTRGAVIVDSDIQLITAAFHSNCGGQTVNSEDVWSKSLYYLRSIEDTFCLKKRNSVWEVNIDANRWKSYLTAHLPATVQDSLIFNYAHQKRQTYYPSHPYTLSFEDIRNRFKLRSTFFEVEQNDQQVKLKGRGYGHGVGLCQEGAMQMASLGYNYSEILHFYYSGVHIIDLSALDFFRED